MITLTRITEPHKLEEYYRFRYRIYSESRLKGYGAGTAGLDKDAFDDRAHHYGWYLAGVLVGCVRFIEADGSATPIPMLNYVSNEAADAVRGYIAERRAQGQPMLEASRFCLAPGHRGLRTAREFVLAMVRTMQPLGYEHGLFDCDDAHVPFYRHCGFEPLAGAVRFGKSNMHRTYTCLTYNYDHIARKQGWGKPARGHKRPCSVRRAAINAQG
ncbi:MAG: GNAT family N-acetyltransferase [Flavobacteriales bacterium]|nr:GNAT family N-acetyltransferase [Flavobacteriales bacterium]